MKQAAEVSEAEGWKINGAAVGVVFSLGRRHGGADRLRREAGAQLAGQIAPVLAPALDTIRLTLHVLAATVWVGGQIVMTGLVGPARGLGPDAPKTLARAFARLAWPAYLVLLVTGVWNITAVGLLRTWTRPGRPSSWPRSPWSSWPGWASCSTSGPPPSGAWPSGARSEGLASVAALVMGILLAG